MVIKNIYYRTKNFIRDHFKTGFLISLIPFLIACGALIFSERKVLVSIGFAFLLVTILRLFMYKHGKLPLFFRDKTWNVCRIKYKDEADDKYKEICLSRATLFFILGVVFLCLWLIIEIISIVIN